MRLFWIAAVSLLPLVSFASDLKVAPATALIVAGGGHTCYGSIVQENRVHYSKVELNWTDERQLTLMMAHVEFLNPQMLGSQYSRVFDQDELDRIFDLKSGVVEPKTVVLSRCGLQAGGISLLSSTPAPFVAEGTLTLYGYTTDRNRDQHPVQLTAPIRAEYF